MMGSDAACQPARYSNKEPFPEAYRGVTCSEGCVFDGTTSMWPSFHTLCLVTFKSCGHGSSWIKPFPNLRQLNSDELLLSIKSETERLTPEDTPDPLTL